MTDTNSSLILHSTFVCIACCDLIVIKIGRHIVGVNIFASTHRNLYGLRRKLCSLPKTCICPQNKCCSLFGKCFDFAKKTVSTLGILTLFNSPRFHKLKFVNSYLIIGRWKQFQNLSIPGQKSQWLMTSIVVILEVRAMFLLYNIDSRIWDGCHVTEWCRCIRYRDMIGCTTFGRRRLAAGPLAADSWPPGFWPRRRLTVATFGRSDVWPTF
jgi:hypothetical protein